jgi:hypothetical protein
VFAFRAPPTDVLINPGYSSANNDQQNPLGANVRDAAGSTSNTNYTFFTSSKYFADISIVKQVVQLQELLIQEGLRFGLRWRKSSWN